MTTLSGAVGIRNFKLQVENAVIDQAKIIALISAIRSEDGGKLGVWTPPLPGPARKCPEALAAAIRDVQEVMRSRGEIRAADGVVDRLGKTLPRLDALAAAGLGALVGPGGTDPAALTFRQTNPPDRTGVRNVTQPVISPLSIGSLASPAGRLQEVPQAGMIREFLFQMRKDGAVYWVGAAVPDGTTDFSQAQVFFHPTVNQNGTVHAAEGDYPTFRGGWSGSLQRYVAMQGGQLAGARLTPLIVPFMTMAAQSGKAPAYMFATRPVETLNGILTAVRDAVAPGTAGAVKVKRVGVSSFSSGIGAMRLFIQSFSGGLIAEVTDFDSPFITREPKALTHSSGAVARVFTQTPLRNPPPGWVTLPAASFANIRAHQQSGPHGQIGFMMFFTASLSSAIR